MNRQTVLIKKAYYAFNTRNIDAALAAMHQDVSWHNGFHNGCVKGHDGLRNFWMSQWQLTDPDVEPVSIKEDEEGNIVAEVRQITRDLHDNVLSDEIVEHIYTLKDGLILSMTVRGES